MQYPQYTANWCEVGMLSPGVLPSEQHRWLAEHEGGKCCVIEFPRRVIRFEHADDATMYSLVWAK